MPAKLNTAGLCSSQNSAEIGELSGLEGPAGVPPARGEPRWQKTQLHRVTTVWVTTSVPTQSSGSGMKSEGSL